jgi:polygalacturonase
MINKIVLGEKIVLYWDRNPNFKNGYKYCISYGRNIVYTTKTHYAISILENTEYIEISVKMVDEKNNVQKEYGAEIVYCTKKKKRLDVTKAPYFALGDGKTLNTKALQQAFDDCKSDETVYIPKGVFLTGALNMHENSTLYLEKGSVLQGSQNPEDYLPKVKSRFEGVERMCYRSLINVGELDAYGGYTTKNITIYGEGAILGGGRALMERLIFNEGALGPIEENTMTQEQIESGRARGRLININNTQNVVIYGLELGMGPAWNIHIVYSDNIVTAGCYIHSENVFNGDGWDPDSSTNCTIFDCDFKTRDDMIAIKSGKNPEGNLINRPSKNIRVFDCRCQMGHGLAIGSEMSGGVENVRVWDCDMKKSRCGFEIKGAKARGGYVKDVSVYNSSFSILAIRSVRYNAGGEAAPTPPVFEDYHFEDITLTGVCYKHTGESWCESAIIAEGFDKDFTLRNVSLKNIEILSRSNEEKHSLCFAFVKGLTIENIEVR